MSLKKIFLIKEAVGGNDIESELTKRIENVIRARGPRDSGALGRRVDELEVVFNQWRSQKQSDDVLKGPFPPPSGQDTGAP